MGQGRGHGGHWKLDPPGELGVWDQVPVAQFSQTGCGSFESHGGQRSVEPQLGEERARGEGVCG